MILIKYFLIAILVTASFSQPSLAQVPLEKAIKQTQSGSSLGLVPITLRLGQAEIVKLPFHLKRVAIADPLVSDYRITGPRELYLLAKSVGKTNVLVWDSSGQNHRLVVSVVMDTQPLRDIISLSFPDEMDVVVASAGSSVILRGSASNAVSANAIKRVAEAWSADIQKQISVGQQGGGQSNNNRSSDTESNSSDITIGVVDLLKIRDPQQVMLEVRIAEISKSLIDTLGAKVSAGNMSGDLSWNVTSGFLGSGATLGQLLFRNSSGLMLGVDIDAERKRGSVKILAEPTLVAISGQEGSFLVGGKLLIPVAANTSGSSAGQITLQERPYGVGVTFLPTVLDNGRINLKVAPEISELSQSPLVFSNGGVTSIVPSFVSSSASTTVQMIAGQSLVIGGLMKNNQTETKGGVPFLSDVPMIGALFRNSRVVSEQTELVIVVRATLVDASLGKPPLPTDAGAVPPTEGGNRSYNVPASSRPAVPLDARETDPALGRMLKEGSMKSGSLTTRPAD
jgi:pilus assembly protein CpaC